MGLSSVIAPPTFVHVSGRSGNKTPDPCGCGAAIHRPGGHCAGHDRGARLWGTEVHGRHDAKGLSIFIELDYRES